MDKVNRDGKVAVLISRGFGAGWFSWHGIEELLYDPYIVNILLNEKGDVQDTIVKYCEEKYRDHGFSGVDGLTVVWINEGEQFIIHEYDGAESIQLKNEFNWLTA